jgi:hypothetical protein
MQHLSRVFLVSSLVLGSLVLGTASPAAAAKKKWPGKKHHSGQHSSSKPASGSKSTGGAKKADDDADDDSGGEAAEADAKSEEAPKKAKKAQATNEGGADEDEGESSKRASRGDGDEEGDGESTVVRRKPKRVAMDDAGAPIAFELAAGARVIHRNFDFHDPLSNYNPSATKPYAYALPSAPAPFLDLALYPAAFATRSFAANVGLVAQYERVIGTSTEAPNGGAAFNTVAQQLQLGARVRVPVSEHEIGLTAAYGKQTFQVTATDPGPGAGSVPNVDYTFAKVGADVRLRLAEVIELGAHVGTRLVFDTGSLGQQWFHKMKTTSIEAGVSLAYRLTPMFTVVAGGDLLRYGFDFNPVPTTAPFVAGGAVDQYLSGYLALRVSFAGG